MDSRRRGNDEPMRSVTRMNEPATKKPLSERKRAAIMANLAKANAAPRPKSRYRRSRHNATKHGLFVRDLKGSMKRLHERPREFRRLHSLLRRAFVPHNEPQEFLVKRLAEAIWRRVRVFRAAARWQLEALHKTFRHADPKSHPGAIVLRSRAFNVMEALLDEQRLARCGRSQ
jgi:hypothetical protein